MNDNEKFADAMPDIADSVAKMIEAHRDIAVPAIISLLVAWSVGHGNAKSIRGILRRAIGLANKLEREAEGYPDTTTKRRNGRGGSTEQ